MAWYLHNFIQSRDSIHATCNNLIFFTRQVWTWVVKCATLLFISFCSNATKQVQHFYCPIYRSLSTVIKEFSWIFFAVSTKEIPKLMKRFARYDPDGRHGGITLKQFLDIPEISTNPIMPKVASAHLDSRSRKITYRSFINMLSRLSPRNSLDDRKECELLL